MHISSYIQTVSQNEDDLAKAFHYVAESHEAEPDIFQTCKMLAGWSEQLNKQLLPIIEKYGEDGRSEPDRLLHAFFGTKRKGSLALLQDLQDLWLMANEASISVTILKQAASALRDDALISLCDDIERQTKRQAAWLLTRIKSAAAQALVAVD